MATAGAAKRRMPLSKDARKYRKQVDELKEKMAQMQVRERFGLGRVLVLLVLLAHK